MTLEELCDREAIRDVIYKYCHAIDRRDPEMLRTVYWPEAVDDHAFVKNDVEAFIAMAMEMVASCVVTQHHVGNILIHLEKDSARVETYVNAYHRIEGPTTPHWRTKPEPIPVSEQGKFGEFLTGSRYLDRMEKRDGVWRISSRKVAQDWYRLANAQNWADYPYAGGHNLGTHNHTDPGYLLFEGVKWR